MEKEESLLSLSWKENISRSRREWKCVLFSSFLCIVSCLIQRVNPVLARIPHIFLTHICPSFSTVLSRSPSVMMMIKMMMNSSWEEPLSLYVTCFSLRSPLMIFATKTRDKTDGFSLWLFSSMHGKRTHSPFFRKDNFSNDLLL
jgi:hypothetical protein